MFSQKITVKSGFQSSVNIALDLHDEEKIKSFIPTSATLEIMEELVLKVASNATNRVCVLNGAYGRGKSHLILMILSLLSQKNRKLFSRTLSKLKQDKPEFYAFLNAYLKSDDKLLPVIIQGSSADLTQSFLTAMEKSLKSHNLESLLPDSNFTAVLHKIESWQREYPDTYKQLQKNIAIPMDEFIAKLQEYDRGMYQEFLKIYPSLTSGGKFNPLADVEVVDLYESVGKKLADHGYQGMYIVYDEFSKYLESCISTAGQNESKLLQDLIEVCNRSREKQMHLLLITHKTMENYLDTNLPDHKQDGWRGVSGRMPEINLQSDFYQMYEMMAQVIQKEPKFWSTYKKEKEGYFKQLEELTCKLSGLASEEVHFSQDCYPLHPLSVFILPRLSELVAQNERTLFTFLSSTEKNTLYHFLAKKDSQFPLLTPDMLYDYFEPLFKKEAYTSELHDIYILSQKVLVALKGKALEKKIIKTIALLYMVDQFDLVAPTRNTLVSCYSLTEQEEKDVTSALDFLLAQKSFLYLKLSNGILKIKKANDLDLNRVIDQAIVKSYNQISTTQVLNHFLREPYLYPTAYNDEKEIVRYFQFVFVESQNLASYSADPSAVGTVFAIVPKEQEDVGELESTMKNLKKTNDLFIIPKENYSIREAIFKYAVISRLREEFREDQVTLDELDIITEDLSQVLGDYVKGFLYPDLRKSRYFYQGQIEQYQRKSQISQRLSQICFATYPHTPVVVNEILNKDVLSPPALKSRKKLLEALMEPELKAKLGLTPTAQEGSFLRSALVRTNLLQDYQGAPKFSMQTQDENMNRVMDTIADFLDGGNEVGERCFQDLYDLLTQAEHGIGLKRGLIPVFLGVVIRLKQKNLVIKTEGIEQEITAETINSVSLCPSQFFVSTNAIIVEKEGYLKKLSHLFIDPAPTQGVSNKEILIAMETWMRNLPKYAQSAKLVYKGMNEKEQELSKSSLQFLKSLKKGQYNPSDYLLFQLPKIFQEEISTALVQKIRTAKSDFDSLNKGLRKHLVEDIKKTLKENPKGVESLASVCQDFLDELKPETFQYLFPKEEQKFLALLKTDSQQEETFLEEACKIFVGLRLGDWNFSHIQKFLDRLQKWKETILAYDRSQEQKEEKLPLEEQATNYQIRIREEDGSISVKQFDKVEYSPRAKLLKSEIETAVEEMGESMTDGEKRQVLLAVLETLC